MRRFLLLLALALPVLAGGVAVAENFGTTKKSGYPDRGLVGIGYEPDCQAAVFRAGLSGADTLTTAGIKATTTFVVKGRQKLVVSGRASNSGATISIRIAYLFRDELTGTETIKGYSAKTTLTADTVSHEGSYFPAPDQVFDTEGAITARVLVETAASAGTFDLWVGSY
jgi:hypothetical protein